MHTQPMQWYNAMERSTGKAFPIRFPKPAYTGLLTPATAAYIKAQLRA